MARVPKKPTAAERARKTTERIRKKEIEPTPALGGGGGGGSSAYCVLGFSADYTFPGSPVSAYSQSFPFDTEVVNTGEFTVDWTYDTGAAVAPNAEGWYRIGLTGRAYWEFDAAGGAGSPTAFASEANYHSFDLFAFPSVTPAEHFLMSQYLEWARIADGTQWKPLVKDGRFFLDIVSGPVHLAAGDYVEATFTPTDAYTVSTLIFDGEGVSGARLPVRFWMEKL